MRASGQVGEKTEARKALIDRSCVRVCWLRWAKQEVSRHNLRLWRRKPRLVTGQILRGLGKAVCRWAGLLTLQRCPGAVGSRTVESTSVHEPRRLRLMTRGPLAVRARVRVRVERPKPPLDACATRDSTAQGRGAVCTT